jgi:hypothetical protein
MVGTKAGAAVTVISFDTDEQPAALVTVTKYKPEVLAVILGVVAPLLHT